jgi:hypothetical protein
MPFHVEVRRSFHRARAFNLDQAELERAVLDPWRAGRPFVLGEREWEPRASAVRVLEGPGLVAADLALGQGWHNAQRSARDVTRDVLGRASAAAPVVAVLASRPQALAAARAALAALGASLVEWETVRPRVLAGLEGAGGPAAVVLLLDDALPDAGWLFEAGLARGALGRRALLVLAGDRAAPPELAALEQIRIVPDDPGAGRRLAERLAG